MKNFTHLARLVLISVVVFFPSFALAGGLDSACSAIADPVYTACDSGFTCNPGTGRCAADGASAGACDDPAHPAACPTGQTCDSLSHTCVGPGATTPPSKFQALVPIPGLTDTQTVDSVASSNNLTTFFNNLYKYLIGIAAILAIFEIIRGGLEISVQESVPVHMKGRERIQHALLGLALVLSPVLVFSIINPNILNLSVSLENLKTSPIIRGSGGSPADVTTAGCSGVAGPATGTILTTCKADKGSDAEKGAQAFIANECKPSDDKIGASFSASSGVCKGATTRQTVDGVLKDVCTSGTESAALAYCSPKVYLKALQRKDSTTTIVPPDGATVTTYTYTNLVYFGGFFNGGTFANACATASDWILEREGGGTWSLLGSVEANARGTVVPCPVDDPLYKEEIAKGTPGDRLECVTTTVYCRYKK